MKTALAALALIVCMTQPVAAGTIEYTWEGTIVPRVAGVDPWNIGEAGRPFTVLGTVDEEAVNIQDLVDTAIFELAGAELLVDGIAPTFLGDGPVSFGDRNAGDRVSIDLDQVEINGVSEPLVALVLLPNSTFALTDVSESPPVFLSATAISGASAISDDSSYRASVETGATVTARVVPEPSTFVLALLAALGAGITFRRGRIR